jgi:menaquinone-specific isochorismate synthase
MTILPLDPAANATPDALRAFLAGCRATAATRGRPQLVSISIGVDALDPLAVLESIFEPTELHFYCERPAQGFSIAGAEAVVSSETSGAGRFEAVQRFIDETLAHTIAVGDQAAPFAGPHFFTAFAFADETGAGEPFPAGRVFVPRWQVAQAGGRTTAVANLLVGAGADLDALAEKIWRAHAKFRAFDYAGPDFPAASAGADSAGPHSAVRHSAIRQNGTDDGDYAAAVRRGLEFIAAGEFKKIVLARAKDLLASQPLHPLRLLNGLRQRFSDCYAFSVANGRGQSFIGASPERLLSVRAGALLTEALAGSARRGATASDDAALSAALAHSDKDLREHRLVLDSIVRRLAPLGLQLEFSEKPAFLRLANVQHLHTPVRAALPAGVRLLDVLARLHPTPAVGGSPRERAVAHIRELEGFPRGLYAGALGWVDARGDGEFFVGLRSALIDGARARLYAGAGIVAGSSPEKEFAETELKFAAMQEAMLA